MIADVVLGSQEEAQAVQDDLSKVGYLVVIWTVTHNTADYRDLYIARPWVNTGAFPYILKAGTLEALREMLPLGLTCISRQYADDPVIIEVWI